MPLDFDDPSIVGKIVLVGLTEYDDNDKVIRTAQWWGTILAYNMRDGLKVDLRNEGEPHSFPPFPDGLRAAKPGRYELRSTEEIIDNPDFLYTYVSFKSGSETAKKFST